MPRAADLLAQAARIVRRVIGAPDYDAYVAYLRQSQPDAVPLAPNAFAHDALARRYERLGSRCC